MKKIQTAGNQLLSIMQRSLFPMVKRLKKPFPQKARFLLLMTSIFLQEKDSFRTLIFWKKLSLKPAENSTGKYPVNFSTPRLKKTENESQINFSRIRSRADPCPCIGCICRFPPAKRTHPFPVFPGSSLLCMYQNKLPGRRGYP